MVPLLGIVLILIATAGGLASKAILLDLAAWWPVWGLVGWLAYWARDARWGKIRVSGLVPFAAVLSLVAFGWGYLGGWALMPSASLQLIGPRAVDYDVAALSARIDGALEVAATSEFLYEVRPLRSGGAIGAAEAMERTQGAGFSVVLQPVVDPGSYLFSGWNLLLADGVTWSLVLQGSEVNADLTALSISELNLLGEGEVGLGFPEKSSPVTVQGAFRLEVPVAAPVRVIGDARVPGDWSQTANGWESPAGGDGWVVSVSPGANLVIAVR